MKKRLLLLIFLVLTMGISYPQCNDYYEWAEDFYQKGNYKKAEKYFYKVIENCPDPEFMAGAYLHLTTLYHDYIPNDSLYWLTVRNQIKLNYRSPYNGCVVERIGFDPTKYVLQPVDADLYHLTREYCRHLCDLGMYDSAWYYFDKYARINQYSSWCGFGLEGTYEHDAVIEADILLHLKDTVKSLEVLSGRLGDREMKRSGEAVNYFVTQIYPIYRELYTTSILVDLIHDLSKNTGPFYYTRFSRYSIYGENMQEYYGRKKYYTHNGTIDNIGLSIVAFMKTSLFEALVKHDTLYSQQVITIRGIARNANPGAYIEGEDQQNYFIDIHQIKEWDPQLYLGRTVEVSGELVIEEEDTELDGHLIHRQINVIKNAIYKLI